MPKPTDRQKAIAEVIQQQGGFWQSTNDINSPTHGCDIDEEITARLVLEDLIDDQQADELGDLLYKLHSFITSVER